MNRTLLILILVSMSFSAFAAPRHIRDRAHYDEPRNEARDNYCTAILDQHAMTRYFRSGSAYVQRRTGMYIGTEQGLKYLPGGKTERREAPPALLAVTSTKNFGSHMEIIRRQLGDARFNEIMRSANPDQALSIALQDDISKTEDQNDIVDAETVKAAIVSEFEDKADLSQLREDQFFAVLRGLGRLGEPLNDWLRPLVLGGKLRQLPTSIMQDPIEKSVKPGTFVYKALKMTVRLNGEKSFFISAGETGSPDSVHRMLLEAIRLLVPEGRIIRAQSGYFVIKQFIPGEARYGEIKFVTKGLEKETLGAQIFDFRKEPALY